MSDIKAKEVNKKPLLSNFFDNRHLTVFYSEKDILLFKKVERVTVATHLITKHIYEAEPIRISLRKKAIQLFSDVAEVLVSRLENDLAQTHMLLSEFTGMLLTAQHSKLISEDNYRLMCRVCEDCSRALSEYAEDISDNATIGELFSHRDQVPSIAEGVHSSKGQRIIIKDKETKGHIEKNISKKTEEHISVKTTPKGLEKQDRFAIIKSIVSREGRVSIKDISNVIKDCSEKTLQRDINTLVEKNVLKKEGERRWSRYVLA